MPAKPVPARRNTLDAGEGEDRSQQEGREGSRALPLVLFFPSRSEDLAYLTTRLNRNKKDYCKSSDLLPFLHSKGGFSPPET